MFGVREEDEILAEPAVPVEVSGLEGPARHAQEIADLVLHLEKPERRFPLERAALLSILVHALLVALWLLTPSKKPEDLDASKGLFANLYPKKEAPIPVRIWPRVPKLPFMESPGPARANPKPAPPSDATRRAGGGDAARAPNAVPFVPVKPGIEGLREGERSPGKPAPAENRGASGRAADQQNASGEGARRLAAKTSPDGLFHQPQAGGQSAPPVLSAQELRRAIAEASRSAAGGEGGAPDSRPRGGFVDSGPLSFDTQWYDWGDYAAEMIRRIKLHWQIPELAKIGMKGRLTIRFYIRADGVVEGERILQGSGIPPFDHAAFEAISTSSPFRALPKELNEDREGVTVTFFYNMHPPGEEGGQSGESREP
jgi:TonB family protein